MTLGELIRRAERTRTSLMAEVTEADRQEFAVALVLQGYGEVRALRMAFDLESSDGALQMMARHRIATAGLQ